MTSSKDRIKFINDELEEMVNHPTHYKAGNLEAIDILQTYFPHNPLLWNATKYILRAERKGNKTQDLRKAMWYIQRELQQEQDDASPIYS